DDDNACDSANPCETIRNTLDRVEPGAHRYIHLEAGVYAQALSISGKDVTLVGDDVTIEPTPGQSDTAVITVGSNTALTIQGIRIQRANGNSNAAGIRCSSADS